MIRPRFPPLTGDVVVVADDNRREVSLRDRATLCTLARPTFRDVARLRKAYGVRRVRQGLERLAASGAIADAQATEWRHRLGNIERGFADAVARLPAPAAPPI